MPWITHTMMSQRSEFVRIASQAGVNMRELCRRYQISAKTGYKWRRRFAQGGEAALADHSRRPKHSPRLISVAISERVIALRRQYPGWCGRKLRRRLQDLAEPTPAASTCTEILRRAHLLSSPALAVQPLQRFERVAPNELWQMDFKGHFPTQTGVRCHPLTVLDDHSRFNLVLAAAADQTAGTVQGALQAAFSLYGLPEAMLCDNGPPWGCPESVCPYSSLGVWLLRWGVRVLHGRPYHPQTQGKDERFHRTLDHELLSRHTWRDLAHCAEQFPRYRQIYNCERPHDSLAGATPLSRYRPSPRSLPAVLPPLEYPLHTVVRKVRTYGVITWFNRSWYIGRAFAGQSIGLRPSPQTDGLWEVYYGHQRLGYIDLRTPALPKHDLQSIYLPPL
jgi:transposase InsO family protein